mmetsp:Transcript_95162/g.291063  ORF Transcript_95162/g.291063 Transcript_95162/m.291063 type:complete len:210 (+) Transcript_95162:608-1237(+)
MTSASSGASSGSAASVGVTCNIVRHCVSLSSSIGNLACFSQPSMSLSVCPSSSGNLNFRGASGSGPEAFGSMKPKGWRSASRGRSRRGPTSPFSAISRSNSPMMSAMIRRTDLPCCGTSPFTAMCKRQSKGSFNSASRPLMPSPRKKIRAPLSVSMRRWCMPPRPMMRLSTLEPYMPRARRLSRKIFSDHKYLFSGMIGGLSLGNFGAT